MSRQDTPRIRGLPVKAFFPASGILHAIIYGEAPGPRGADQSGVPFWGDGAGIPLYRALVRAGRAIIPDAAWEPWDGARLRNESFWPNLQGIALSNAFPACPTDDGHKFRTPKRAELQSPLNLERIAQELSIAAERGASIVITLGRCAQTTLQPLADAHRLSLLPIPHPSAQGLLMSAPNKGRGMRLADLRVAWEDRLVEALA